jgi:hypothetical protein
MMICGKAHHARCGRPRIAARRKSLRVQIARSWECNQFVCGPGCGNHAEKNPVFVRSYDPCMVVAGCAPRREETSGVARPASPPCGRRAHGQMRRRACRRHAVSHRVADVFEQRSARHRIAAAGTRERAPRAESPADHQAASRFRARRLFARVTHGGGGTTTTLQCSVRACRATSSGSAVEAAGSRRDSAAVDAPPDDASGAMMSQTTPARRNEAMMLTEISQRFL